MIINKIIFAILFSILSSSLFGSVNNSPSYELLKEPLVALNARIRPLLGRNLTDEEYRTHDPYRELDLSNAPDLKIIVLSSLVITHDFVGTLILRLLEHHAKLGTEVYVMVTKQLIHDKEKKWLLEFSKSSPQIHFTIYSNEESTLWTKIQSTNHVKIFLTMANTPENECSLISGGRNTSDMYFFEEMPLHSKYPELVQWGSKKYEWAYFDDLDLLTKDCSMVQEVKDKVVSYIQKTLESESLQTSDYFFSLPKTKNLELKYVDLINNAQKSIKILSPYLNFTKNIFDALIAAKKRGVEIEIITSKSIENDYLPIFLQPAMNHSLRKILKHINVYLFSHNKDIPHAKALLIDDSLLSIGSINMNQRSFYFDTEFTQFIENTQLISDFNKIFQEHYMTYSQKVDSQYQIDYHLMETLVLGFHKSF